MVHRNLSDAERMQCHFFVVVGPPNESKRVQSLEEDLTDDNQKQKGKSAEYQFFVGSRRFSHQ